MTVVGFALTYFYLTYLWWSSYSEQLYQIPKYKTAGGYLLLTWFGMGVAQYSSVFLGFTALSAVFHFNKDQWNPFHSGFVAASLAVIFICGNVALFSSGDPTQWIQSSQNAATTSLIAGTVMAATTIATIRIGHPIRYVTVLSGLYKERGGIDPKAARRAPEKEVEHSNGQENGDAPPDVDPEDLRVSPENHPFKDGNTAGEQAEETDQSDTSTPDTPPVETENSSQQQSEPAEKKASEKSNGESESTSGSEDAETTLDEYKFPWEEPPETRFQNIGGYNGVKDDLRDQVVAPLRGDTDSYDRFGVEPSRGILFHGPPGTGKTLFARALANELNLPFVELNQADLTHEYVNKSPQLISRLFEEAQELNGVVFIDEAEQLLGARGGGMNTHKEDQKITNTFLSALTQENQNFIVLLTTNRRDKMDEAILRPGRVDEEFEIGMPNKEARTKILKVKLADIPHKLSLDHVKTIAEKTEGWSGADLNNLVNQAKIEAAGRGAEYLKLDDIKVGYEETKDATQQ